MTIESIDGIIISETNYSESSKILNILTKEHGLIGVMSKGCRNMKSKLRGVSRKLLYGTIHIYYKPNGLSTLIGIDVKESFSKTIMDLEKISYSAFVLDLCHQVLRQNEDENIFDLLKATLLKIEEGRVQESTSFPFSWRLTRTVPSFSKRQDRNSPIS